MGNRGAVWTRTGKDKESWRNLAEGYFLQWKGTSLIRTEKKVTYEAKERMNKNGIRKYMYDCREKESFPSTRSRKVLMSFHATEE